MNLSYDSVIIIHYSYHLYYSINSISSLIIHYLSPSSISLIYPYFHIIIFYSYSNIISIIYIYLHSILFLIIIYIQSILTSLSIIITSISHSSSSLIILSFYPSLSSHYLLHYIPYLILQSYLYIFFISIHTIFISLFLCFPLIYSLSFLYPVYSLSILN
jgi:hypothetical protein